jgi:alpha-tubulin suppressor-like RCC1 family protein
LFAVGCNNWGCIGGFSIGDFQIINRMSYFSSIFIVDIVCGCDHCLAISDNGQIFGWGSVEFGQIGNRESGLLYKITNPFKIFQI